MGVLHMKSFERQQDIFMHELLFNVTNNSKQQFWRDIYKLPKIQYVAQYPGEGTWVVFGWVCAARDSKLAPRSKKNFP